MVESDPEDGHVHSQDDGTVSRAGEELVLRFERLPAHPIGKVWAALTDPTRCARWLGDLGHELVQDGPFELSADGREIAGGTVTELVPPSGDANAVVEYTWQAAFSEVGSAVIRWELTPAGDRTRLVLTQTANAADFLAEGAAGWHGFLDRLASALDDEPVVADHAAWRTRRARYSESFGVPPNPAIP
jgi:uncharacterized protein YndB with AHSA1/START domain